jgi:succinate dehydrogenase/fumarate reductase flavoprotein subunit
MHKLRILARAEMALARIKAQRTGFQVALFAVAALFALVGLALLNLAAYNALIPRLGPSLAALAVGGGNLLLAAVAVIIALKARPGSADEKMAQEIRDLASEEIKKDVDDVRDDINRISDEIAGIRAGIASIREGVPGGVRSVVDLANSVRKGLDDLDSD